MEHSQQTPAWAERPRPFAVSHAPMNQLPLALFDEIECGLIVCDGRGTISFANQAAQQELAASRVLQQLDGCLRRTARAEGDLDGALRAASLRGRRSLVRLGQQDERLLVSVLPLELPDAECRHVLVMLGRRQPCSDLGLEMLAGCYGLTLAERRVLAALMREATPREIAHDHAVALSTVRTQISSIRIKLGTRRIEGLLLRAAEMPPMASALRHNFPGHAGHSRGHLQMETALLESSCA
jgi:DNA-binding CsgD family transcriptional regulator